MTTEGLCGSRVSEQLWAEVEENRPRCMSDPCKLSNNSHFFSGAQSLPGEMRPAQAWQPGLRGGLLRRAYDKQPNYADEGLRRVAQV
jgi:hypothetical protein